MKQRVDGWKWLQRGIPQARISERMGKQSTIVEVPKNIMLGKRREQDAELKDACHDSVLGRRTLPTSRAHWFRCAVGQQNCCRVYSRSEWAPSISSTSIARPARNGGMNGDLWRRFFDACDGEPNLQHSGHTCGGATSQRRRWKSAARRYSTCGAGRQRERRSSRGQARPAQVQTMDGMAWQVRMRIIEANLAASSGQSMREFLPPRLPVLRKTRQQKKKRAA